MSHRLGAVSSDYCSVCQNGPLPSAAASASSPLWPLAAPFLMTNCQPVPTKARLKCQHRMTKGPRGSSETNCVQYELILYSRAGPAGCWRPGLGSALRLLQPRGGPASAGGGRRAPQIRALRGPQRSPNPGRGVVATGDGTNLGRGMQNMAPAVSPVPWVLSPMYTGHRPSGSEGGRENAQAAENHSPQTNAHAENPAPASSHVPSLGLYTYGGATARRSAAQCLLISTAA